MGTFRVKAGMAETLAATYNQRAVPKVRAVAGNLGCMLLEPATSDEEFVVLTLWKDQAAAERYESSGGAAEVVALVRDCFAGPPSLRSYASGSESGLA